MVVNEIPETARLSKHTIVPGETVFQSIDRLFSLFRVFSTDDEQGRLVLAKPGSGGRASDALELGKNILSASAPMDYSQVFSEYRVIGQQKGSDTKSGRAVSEVESSADRSVVQTRRTTVINEGTQLTFELARNSEPNGKAPLAWAGHRASRIRCRAGASPTAIYGATTRWYK
jgi:prophage tail gpP-like protein